MTKKVVLVRFGFPGPVPQITAVLKPHISDWSTASALIHPGGVISLFKTESTLEQISSDLKQIGVLFFLFEANQDFSNLPPSWASLLGALCEPETVTQTELTIDDVLLKITDHGMDSLTEEELAILHRGKTNA